MHNFARSPLLGAAALVLWTSSASIVHAQIPAQAQAQVGAQAAVAIDAPAAQPASVAARIQVQTGLALSPSAKRYLAQRIGETLPSAEGWCRDQARTFDVEHRSYGSHSPRARQQLNDCSPTLRPAGINP